jgi:AcrR family transcriptional regulator
VPRAGLDPAAVATAGAVIADEVGFANLTMGLVAERLGVRTPSLYKHVTGQADLNRRIAALAMTELGDELREALQGLSGREALAAAAQTFRRYVIEHPGRYAATIGVEGDGPDDPISVAGARAIASLAAVLRGYRIEEADSDHALRMVRSLLHGFSSLQLAGGFRWSADVDESFEWLIDFVDRGLRQRAA